MTRRLILAASALALVLPIVPSATFAAVPGVNVSRLTNNGDPYARSPSDAAAAWQQLVASGAKTVRAFAPWRMDSLQLSEYSQFATKARQHGMAVDLDVTGTAGDMTTPSTYAKNVGELAARLKGQVVAYEIWNEEDDTTFWKDGPQPADYTAMLKAAYRSIKAADPNANVFVGGLVGNDFDFLDQLYANGAKGYFDGVAVHTDTACNTSDPTAYYREPSGRIGRYSFTGYREVRETMVEHGDAKPIWMTELGWSTAGGICDMGQSAGTKPAGVSEAQQATFLTHAYQCLADDSYVQQGLWFNLTDFDSSSSASANRFGLTTDSLTRKPAFDAFTHAGGLGGIPCGGAMDSSRPTVQIVKPADQLLYYTGLVPVQIVAHDDQSVQDINVRVDGHNVGVKTVKHGATATADLAWWGAGKLAFGPHTLVASARDDSHNIGTTQVTIVRVGGGGYNQLIGSRLRMHYGKVRHRRMAISGGVRFTNGVRGSGTVEMRFFRRVHGHWKRKTIRHRSPYKPFRYAFRFSGGGSWRVKARFIPRGPYQPAGVRTKTFRVR